VTPQTTTDPADSLRRAVTAARQERILLVKDEAVAAVTRERSFDLDAEFLHKPLTVGSLTRRVRGVLDGRGAAGGPSQ